MKWPKYFIANRPVIRIRVIRKPESNRYTIFDGNFPLKLNMPVMPKRVKRMSISNTLSVKTEPTVLEIENL